MPIGFWILVSLWSAIVLTGTLYYMFLQEWLLKRKQYKAQDYRFNKIMRESNALRFDVKGG
ncbi:hypothetical protein [Brochothrix thermosphacta]|uniref:hypothetical protein n=1 Tax=Brochothrix thermosphacta TaxID=2756 RepID=UPI00083F7FAB|nr:hypothetical protein [Brochothrix thermosphacta]ODJ54828.1 hypothetical protein BFR41_06915 [Brochothrix thermosphacta]ODJ66924.1 hypothetical protein BFR37_07330 [Brochothrix thermosphacta]